MKRFWCKVNKSGPTLRPELGPCWLWTGATMTTSGYGRFRMYSVCLDGPCVRYAHCVAFFLEHGRWPKPFGLHKCDNPSCVRPAHIFEGTAADNAMDCSSKGIVLLGSRRPNAKLTETQVQRILVLRATGKWTLKRLADKYGVCFQAISSIVNKKGWKHVCA